MAITSLLTGARGEAEVGSLQLDVSIEELHSFKSTVTREPVEDGADVTDNVINDPQTFQMTGSVSNHPINFLGPLRAGFRRADKAFAALEKIHTDKTPVKIVTKTKTYNNMVMESCEIPKTVRYAEVTRFTATFVQITTVKSGTAKVPNTTNDRAKPQQNAGRKPPKPAPAAKAQSILSKGKDLVLKAPSILGLGG